MLNDRDCIIISNHTKVTEINYIINDNLNDLNLPNHTVKFELITDLTSITFSQNTAYLDFDKITFPLKFRYWKHGDKIQPFGMHGHKLISDILIDKKINRFQKEKQTVFESNKKIVWLTELVVSNHFAITKNTKKVLKIEIHQILI